ncbi:MAG: beta-galactosidase [Phycisphaerales bacterium]
MKRLGVGLGLLMCFAVAGRCDNAAMNLIAVGPDGRGFVEQASGTPYVPFGANYYDPHTGWAPKIWRQFDPNAVTRHFQIMSGLGVNCARIFLTAATFQPDVNTVDEAALKKLDAMIAIARRSGVRLILTGPDHWEGVPAYWKPDRFAGEQALRALEIFWRTLGRRYRGEPAIFAWDLLNEPHLPWFVEDWRPAWGQWLQAKYDSREALKTAWSDNLGEQEDWASIAVPEDKAEQGSPRLRDWQLFREHLADQWTRRQAEALRKADPTHLITVGYIQWSYPLVRTGNPSLYAAFNPRRQAQWLDFVCMHFYPILGGPFESQEMWDKNLAYLQTALAYCHVGKPVVLEEYGWYGGGAPRGLPSLTEDQQARWIVAEIEASRRVSAGWLSWPFADTPDSTDMSKFGGLVRSDLTPKPWAERFKDYAAKLSALPQPLREVPVFDFAQSLTMPATDLEPLQKEFIAKTQAAIATQ